MIETFLFYGYKVVASPTFPRWSWTGPLVVSAAFNCSDAAREAFNDWAVKLFGGAKITNFIVSEINKVIYAHPALIYELRKHANGNGATEYVPA